MLFLRFVNDRKGGVAPLFALALLPILGSMGAAVDYSRANSARTAMQATLDATAVILTRNSQQLSGGDLTQEATNYFKANFLRPEVGNLAVTASSSSTGTGSSLTMSATGTIKTTFMGVMGVSSITLTVGNGAFVVADGLGCVLSLNQTAAGATTGQGSTSVNLNNCSLYDNSNNATALTVGGSARISALSVGVVGHVSGADNIITTQGISTGIGPVPDPYADVTFPSFSGCTETNYTGKKTETINPGVYCGGMTFNANTNVTMKPGIYYLDGGSFTANGGAVITGTGVTLVFTSRTNSNFATATVNGNANVNLTPPNFGPTAGIVIFADRRIPTGTSFKFNGGASQYFGGAIYVPTGAVTYAGGASTSTSCTQIIGDTVSFVGNSNLAINCSSYATRPFSARIVRLVS